MQTRNVPTSNNAAAAGVSGNGLPHPQRSKRSKTPTGPRLWIAQCPGCGAVKVNQKTKPSTCKEVYRTGPRSERRCGRLLTGQQDVTDQVNADQLTTTTPAAPAGAARETLVLPDGFNGAVRTFNATPVKQDGNLLLMQCADPGEEYLQGWYRKETVEQATLDLGERRGD